MYKIGEFSILARVSVKSLRFYEEMGLFKPCYVDAMSGYRYYETEQLIDIARIVQLRQAGVSIESIRKVLSGEELEAILQERRNVAAAEVLATEKQLLLIDNLIKNIRENKHMQLQATVKTIPQYTVYYKRGVISSFSEIVSFILGSAEECRAANPNIKCLEPDYCFVSYRDGKYKETNVSVEYAQAVTAAGKETENIKFRVLPETKAVCVYHKGSFATIGQTYAFAFEFVKSNGYTINDYPRERCINGMWNCDKEEDWLTEIQVPIK